LLRSLFTVGREESDHDNERLVGAGASSIRSETVVIFKFFFDLTVFAYFLSVIRMQCKQR